MLLHYDWPADVDVPAVGAELDVSGNPDRPVLHGQVWRVNPEHNVEDGTTTISIMLEDGQAGAEEFQEWVLGEGDIGVMPRAAQSQTA